MMEELSKQFADLSPLPSMKLCGTGTISTRSIETAIGCLKDKRRRVPKGKNCNF